MASRIVERIDSLEDPRIAEYRNLRDRTLRGESLFLAEGTLVTRRLLASGYKVRSLFVARQFLETFLDLTKETIPIYYTEEKLISQIVGFPFHGGVLAAGERRLPPDLHTMLEPWSALTHLQLLLCPEVTKPENLGLIFRSAAAFRLTGVILGHRCCDPLSRRVLRVSMGAVLQMTFCRCEDPVEALQQLRQRCGVATVAAIVDRSATELPQFTWPARSAVILGNEFYGLTPEILDRCDFQVTIPMSPLVDSLNLGVAASIFAYAMTQARQGSFSTGAPTQGDIPRL